MRSFRESVNVLFHSPKNMYLYVPLTEMKKLIFISLFFFVSALLLTTVMSCRKSKAFPVEPKIEFLRFVKYGTDSAEFEINFTDGDGDIGLNQGDTNAPYQKTGRYYNNIFLRYEYYDTSNVLHSFYVIPFSNPSDTLDNNYRIPVITPNGQVKSLNGEIHVRLYAPYAVHAKYRFSCFIYDRALHKSNVIESTDLTP